ARGAPEPAPPRVHPEHLPAPRAVLHARRHHHLAPAEGMGVARPPGPAAAAAVVERACRRRDWMKIAKITGTGSFLPGPPIDNKFLVEKLDRRLVWLTKFIGAEVRYSATDPVTRKLRDGMSNAEMAYRAAAAAIENAQIDPKSIELIIMMTATPDYAFPPSALFVQEKLGLQGIKVMELRASCGGTSQVFAIAKSFIETGVVRNALLIG